MSFLDVSATNSKRSGQGYGDSFRVDVMTAADLSKDCVTPKTIRWHESVFLGRNVKVTCEGTRMKIDLGANRAQ